MDWPTFWGLSAPYFGAIIIFGIAVLIAFIIRIILPRVLLRFTPKKFYEANKVLILNIVKTLFRLTIIASFYLAVNVTPIFDTPTTEVPEPFPYPFWRYKTYWDVVMILILAVLIANMLSRIVKYIIERNADAKKRLEKTPNILSNLITALMYIVIILVILSYFNIDITPLIATLGIAGFAIGFAVKTPLENLISGLYLLIIKPIAIGDYIELGGSEGYVDNIQMTSTKIRTLAGSIILIPNTIIISSIISNHTILSKEKSVILNVKVAQNADLHHILKASKEVADHIQNTVPECAPNFNPVVLFTDLEANALNILIVLKAQKIEVAGKVKHELLLALLTRFRQEKIDIPPPMRRYDSGLPMEEKPGSDK